MQWLMELTALPTASGREQRVASWIEKWCQRRSAVTLRRDRFGNLLLQRRSARSRSPIILTAHMDHPAFVVAKVIDAHRLEADFRGGVSDSFFVSGEPRVTLHHASGCTQGRIAAFRPASGRAFKGARIEFDEPVSASAGDAVTWSLGEPRADLEQDRFYAPVCDDLVGAAAGLAAFDALMRLRGAHRPDVRLLLTRAEEIGFIGAIGACQSGLVPRRARLINLECSKSFADSPLGGGPIVRVGDKTSTFDPDLTYRVGQIASEIAQRDSQFHFQRRLMPGGTCEASAFQSFGYAATGLCLPLDNYHNMNDATGMIDAETISLSDFAAMVRLLIEVGKRLDKTAKSPPLRTRLEQLFAERRSIVQS
jgi:endoglucanase